MVENKQIMNVKKIIIIGNRNLMFKKEFSGTTIKLLRSIFLLMTKLTNLDRGIDRRIDNRTEIIPLINDSNK